MEGGAVISIRNHAAVESRQLVIVVVWSASYAFLLGVYAKRLFQS